MPLPKPILRLARRRSLSTPLLLARISQAARPQPTSTIHCKFYSQRKKHYQKSFFTKLREVLKNTKTEWYAIPFSVGVGVVGFTQIRRNSRLEPTQYGGDSKLPEHEKQIRPMGPWQVQVFSTLPFKVLSYYWGRFNEIPLPRILRGPGFMLYSWVFGVNLDEVAEPLDHYRNLAEFFYRQLKPGCRPIDPRPNAVVSPADGRVLQFGEVCASGQVEQVKGMTYSLDALLGTQGTIRSEDINPNGATLVKKKLAGKGVEPEQTTARRGKGGGSDPNAAVYSVDEEFANVNGISYTLPSLLSGPPDTAFSTDANSGGDVSVPASASDTLEVGTEVARATTSSWFTSPQRRLFFCVVYLAPGDYHRFHSPVSWVVERRRHFAGELYSVSPWLQSRLKDLFVLNERIVLLGRWRHGMFSMTPVGATNVGSIKIHFDRELRTNTLTHDVTKASKKEGFAEATYKGASALLGGYPLTKGAEIGGFNLGSTVVLVFEAPATNPDGPPGQGGFRFCIERGQYVKTGQALGMVEE